MRHPVDHQIKRDRDPSDLVLPAPQKKQQIELTPQMISLISITTSVLILHLSLTGTLITAAVILAIVFLLWPRYTVDQLQKFNRWSRKKAYRRQLLALMPVILLTAFYILFSATQPAYAMFLEGTQDWMEKSFTGIDTTMVALIFNVLRAIFVIYLAVALARVIAAARNDEDWSTLARTPMIVVVTVVIGDLLADFITGGSGTNTASK